MPKNHAGGARFVSDSPEATRAFAAKFAKNLPDDAFVALSGDLGTGKTAFVKGIAEGLGISARVKSPSYNILSLYDAPDGRKLAHIDAYRLDSPEAFENLALDEVAPAPRCVCVEWWENVAECVPQEAIKIEMSILPDGRHAITIL
ncbi:tRNA (adenosine(37)-N6)-threonylcarbamoyltransferase complex ATPase subunit type 1 TsaE [Opitutia bacterium KCR 482]|mgnify:CR=1 FL=1|nr:tRNA (adenosine(37)-N6)-threonylcarbamoyltransferase complex ATPase subunit type 1 TsaE [Opitutae bacterium KCR 482]